MMILPKNIVIGNDHAGVQAKKDAIEYIASFNSGVKIINFGTDNENSVDYPNIARDVCNHIINTQNSVGILICGTGNGMNIVANKMHGIRSALVHNRVTARMSRDHNDCNVMCLGAREGLFDDYKELLRLFLMTPFNIENKESYCRRVEQIQYIEQNNK